MEANNNSNVIKETNFAGKIKNLGVWLMLLLIASSDFFKRANIRRVLELSTILDYLADFIEQPTELANCYSHQTGTYDVLKSSNTWIQIQKSFSFPSNTNARIFKEKFQELVDLDATLQHTNQHLSHTDWLKYIDLIQFVAETIGANHLVDVCKQLKSVAKSKPRKSDYLYTIWSMIPHLSELSAQYHRIITDAIKFTGAEVRSLTIRSTKISEKEKDEYL